MLFLTMIPPSCFLGVFATSFYIKGVIWRSFLQKKNFNWIYYQYIPWWLEIHQYSHIKLYRVLHTALTLQKVIFTISFKWYTLLIWRLTLSLYKIDKSFFSLKSCMQISAICVNSMTSLSVILLQYHKRFSMIFKFIKS